MPSTDPVTSIITWYHQLDLDNNKKFPGRSSLGKNVYLSCLDFWASQQLWSCSPSSLWSPTSSSSWSAATMTTTTLPTSFPNAQVLTQVNFGHHQILGTRLTLKTLTIFAGVLLTKQFSRRWLWVLEEMCQTLIVILVRWRLWEALPIARFIYAIATGITCHHHITSNHVRSLPCFLNPEQEW